MQSADDVVVTSAAFPRFELTVVGHIHKPQQFRDDLYYVGALDRMDIGEQFYEPRVLLADIGPAGVRSVESLPLDPTPFANVVAASEEELRAKHAAMDRPDDTLVRLKLEAQYGTFTAPLIDLARTLFPRIYGNVEHEWIGTPAVAPSVEGLDRRDVAGTIRRYLEEQVPDEAERSDLLGLVDELRAARTSP